MGLVMKPLPVHLRHDCVPVPGEFGRYYVNSRSAEKKGLDEKYIVDVLAEEHTNAGIVIGVCPCKGWQVRKNCSHLIDAKHEHARLELAKSIPPAKSGE
jgi:hypothetical protein